MEDVTRPPAPVVPLRGGPRANNRRRRAERETAAIRSGAAAISPIVLFCHLRGDSEAFPRRWRWGTLQIGQGQPVFRPAWFSRRRGRVAIPEGTKQVGAPRAVLREELSAFCPNPRKSVVLPLEGPDGRIFVGLARESVDTLVAALEAAAHRPRAG